MNRQDPSHGDRPIFAISSNRRYWRTLALLGFAVGILSLLRDGSYLEYGAGLGLAVAVCKFKLGCPHCGRYFGILNPAFCDRCGAGLQDRVPRVGSCSSGFVEFFEKTRIQQRNLWRALGIFMALEVVVTVLLLRFGAGFNPSTKIWVGAAVLGGFYVGLMGIAWKTYRFYNALVCPECRSWVLRHSQFCRSCGVSYQWQSSLPAPGFSSEKVA